MPRRPCKVCGTPTEGSLCPTHRREEDARRNAKTVAHGVKRAHFQRLRREVLTVSGGLCELRLNGCTKTATTVHLDPRLDGNHDVATVDDCKAACARCHGVVDGGRSRPRRVAA